MEAMGTRRPDGKYPLKAYYKKVCTEAGPTWADRKAFVHDLATNSLISPAAKRKLRENEAIIPHFQFRGFKYGSAVALAVFFFMPVVRKQTFLRRAGISLLPFAGFMSWGYTWGHENWWRQTYEIVANYEIYLGNRSRFTMK